MRLQLRYLIALASGLIAVLAAVAALPHAGLGHISWHAVAFLLTGSLPGMWAASHLHGRIPGRISEGILAAVLLGMGLRIFTF